MSVLETDTGPRPKGTNINLSFGYHPGYTGNVEHFHYGTDLRAAIGDPDTYPRNLTPGLVIIAGPFGGYGLCMVIRWIDKTGTRWYLLYGHMYRLFYGVGSWVSPGAVIGESDATGYVVPPGPGGSHLHFAVGRESYYGGGWVDPIPWLAEYTAPKPPTEQEQLEMTFTDAELANLHRQARPEAVDAVEWAESFRGFLSPIGFAARDAAFDSAHDTANQMDHVDIGIRRLRELFQALQLTKGQIAALPEPKYTTLKRFLVDLQEQAQEEPVGGLSSGTVVVEENTDG